MMKKNGFTLAEVLITLAIIGVVATLTLPALMTNTQEQQAKTAFKKGINTLTEAAQMNQAISGFDYASLSTDSTDDSEAQSLYGLLSTRANINYDDTGSDTTAANSVNNGATNFVIFFRDGSALSYVPENAVATSNTTVNTIQTDGLVYGIAAIYDTNGKTGPNLLSNCQGNSAMTGGSTTGDTDDNCSDKTMRVIKDQFGIRLRGSYAVPNGAAARWAFEN